MHSLHNILKSSTNKRSWLSLIALFIGCLLLFLSIQLFFNVQEVLDNKARKKDGFEYLVVNKKITNAMMGNATSSYFTNEEINDMCIQKAVSESAVIVSNRFGINASALGQLAFSTQLFFEALPDTFLDVVPENWTWSNKDDAVPIILSAEYLNLYNFGFALSQGLPQMSEETIKAIPFNITIYDASHEVNFNAIIVGFTQRYSSIIVPMSFMQYANQEFGAGKKQSTSRIILKTKEADNPALVHYLQAKNYATQNEKLKSSTLKSILNLLVGISSFFAIIIVALSVLLLLMQIKVWIIQSQQKLKLLHILGYNKRILVKHFMHKRVEHFLVILLFSLIIVAVMQFILSKYLNQYGLVLTQVISWQVVCMALLSSIGFYYLFQRKVRRVMSEVL